MLSRALCILCICSQLCSCTSMRVMNSPAAPGDSVRVVTRDQRELKFVVERSDADRICSDRQCVSAEEVATIERQEIDKFKTGVLVLLFVLLVGMGAAAGSMGGFMGAPAL
jgi:hypothetical protein